MPYHHFFFKQNIFFPWLFLINILPHPFFFKPKNNDPSTETHGHPAAERETRLEVNPKCRPRNVQATSGGTTSLLELLLWWLEKKSNKISRGGTVGFYIYWVFRWVLHGFYPNLNYIALFIPTRWLGCGFKHFFYKKNQMTISWKDDEIWRAYFSNGLKSPTTSSWGWDVYSEF